MSGIFQSTAAHPQYNRSASPAFRAVLVFLAALAYFVFFHRYGFFVQDEGVLAYQALRVSRGQLPYADFQTAYPPAAYYLHALIFDLFGPSLATLRLVGAVASALTAALLFVAAARVLPRGYAGVPSLLYVLLEDQESRGLVVHVLPYPTRYVEMLWAGSLCVTLAYARRPRWLPAVALGLMTAAVAAFKHTAGIYLAWAVALCLVLSGWERAASAPPPRSTRVLAAVPLVFLVSILVGLAVLFRGFGSIGGLGLLVWYVPLPATALLLLRHVLSRPADPAEAERRRAALAAIGADLCWFAGAAALLTALWVTYFAVEAGPHVLAQRLFLDAPLVARSYGLTFPAPGGLAVGCGLLLAAGLGGRTLARRGLASPRAPARAIAWTGGALAVGALAWGAGFLRQPLAAGRWEDVFMHLGRRVDNLVVYLVPVVTYTFLARLRTWLARGGSLDRSLLGWVHGVCALLLAFPRIDVAHVYQGLVILFVPGTVLAWRALAALRAAAAPARARWLPVAAAGALAAVAALKLLPRAEAQFTWHDGPMRELPTVVTGARGGLYATGNERPWFEALNRTTAFLAARTSPGTPIFAFPALAAFYFLADRPNPTPFDYFHQGFGEGRGEVAVITALEASRTPLVVTMSDHTFDPEEKGYFPILKDYLRRHFVQSESFGPFRILERVTP